MSDDNLADKPEVPLEREVPRRLFVRDNVAQVIVENINDLVISNFSFLRTACNQWISKRIE